MLKKYGETVLSRLRLLSNRNKFVLGLVYINRQSDLVRLFDRRYGTDLYALFCAYIREGLAAWTQEKALCIDIEAILSATPDADDYSAIECTYVQNALISLYYLFDFYSKGDDTIEMALNMVLENIDIIAYSVDKQYDEEKVFASEEAVMNSIMDKIEHNTDTVHHWIENEDKLMVPGEFRYV